MDQSKVIRDFLKEELAKFEHYLHQLIQSPNPRVMNIVEHVFKADGKRVRPMMVLLTAKSCGQITEATYHAAATVELLHTATLIHDDVVDEAKMRRGQPSVNALFDNLRSVLSGDYFLSTSLRESVKTGNLEIIDIIAQLGQNLAEGELNQYALANEMIIDEAEYLNVIDKKTASLLYACTKIGAMTANANAQTVEKFGQLGRTLGLCFQIRDDIFDYYNTDVGKPTGNDIREGKITLPLIYALRETASEKKSAMMDIIHARNFTSEYIAQLVDFTKENGGIDYAYTKIDMLIAEAESLVQELPIDEDYKSMFRLFMMYFKDRLF